APSFTRHLFNRLMSVIITHKSGIHLNASITTSHYLCHAGECTSPCLNGGWCVHPDSCNCTLYQATGTHCQTVPNLGFEREMTCRSWGQYNYETFDGLYYYFPGKCSYTLLRDCEDSTRSSVHIQVHNDPECSSFPYSCTRSISLFLPWEGEIRLQNFSVTFKGQSVQLPHHIHDVELERISDYIVVSQPQGFTLAWQGLTGSVYIKMSPEFVGHTCGLCGNFNADTQDDLKTSYGVFTQDLAMFGNSWAEEEPQLGRCPVVPSLYPSPCDSGSSLQKVEEVCATLLKEPFQSCHEFVSPYSYMASCSNDLCLSGPNGDVVCQVFIEYARACAHAGHPLHNWRSHFPVCSVDCPAELLFRECITCCPMHCKIEHMCIDSKLQCLDGCYCPDDLIYENGVCVKASDCPCEHHGMLYPSGHVIQEDCNNCTCVGGMWNCTENSCPGECSVTGDMFFQSFDGRIYTFPATCQYVLAKSRNSGKFTVTIQNAPCGANLDGACIQSVNLMVGEDPRTEITMSHSGEVFLASQFRISLPYSDDVFQIQELSSMFVQVKSSQGLQLQYNWREFRLYLQLEEQWRDDTVGLCGTFNGNIQDDFLAPSGMIESTPYLFGNAWRVSSACVARPSLPQLDPCDTHQQAAAYAVEKCDVLTQEVFSACHEYVSPVGFQLQCRADVCKCGAPCLCSILAHYARTCRRHGVIIEFRSHLPECAITCPSSMEYGVCVSSCQRRCLFLSLHQPCGEECEEGCVCPEGTYFNMHTHTCVPRVCSLFEFSYLQCWSSVCVLSSLSDTLCPPGQFYEDCGNRVDGHSANKGLACEQTCESYLLNLTCSTREPCVPGCVCPAGLLKHGDECFEPHACPCLWKGKEYYPGDRVSSPCHQCVCQHGTFQCEFRPCPSMCTAYGDRHYRTFDGFLFDYIGACKVYLVKSSLDAMITVTAENVDCFESGVICRKSLLISLGRSFIVFDDDTGKPNPSSVIDRQKVYIWQAGYYTIVHLLGEDLTVLWDRKSTVHIQAGPRWQGKLTGLCGNFDQKTANEMRTPENIDLSTPQEFGNSWTAAECVNSPDIRHPCNLNPLREPFAKRQCGILLSEVFQVCHPVVDVTWFYMNCLVDTCGCNRGGDCECFCTSVAAYAHRCCQKGVTIDWRSPSVCPYDCEYYNKALGKGPLKLLTYRERGTLLAANKTSGLVFPKRELTSTDEILTLFMMTPGISKARPHDTSLVSFEAAERPNYFLKAEHSGQLRLQKWEEAEAFWDAATFVLHRDTWISGFDSLESLAKPGFFLHFMLSRLQLMKYSHSDRYRRATLFKLTGGIPHYPMGPRCQWRYESCVSPCFRACSDPSGLSCASILKVEGCLPQCPSHMVLDEVTHRCVFMEDCIKPAVVPPFTPPSTAISSTSSSEHSTLSGPAVSSTVSGSSTTASIPTTHMPSTAKLTSSPIRPGVVETITTLTTSTSSPSPLASTERTTKAPSITHSSASSTTVHTSPMSLSETLSETSTTSRPTESLTLLTRTTAIPSPSTFSPVLSSTSSKELTRVSTLPVLPVSTSISSTDATSPTLKVSSPLTSSTETLRVTEAFISTQKSTKPSVTSSGSTQFPVETISTTKSTSPSTTTPILESSTSVTTEKLTFPTSLHTVKTPESTSETQRPLDITTISTSPTDIEQPETSKTTVSVPTAVPTAFITTVFSQAPAFVPTETTAKTTYQPTSVIYPYPDVPTTDITLQTDWRVIQTTSTPSPETTQTSARIAETPLTTYTSIPFTSAPTEETSIPLTSHVSPTDKTTSRDVSASTTPGPTESHWSLVSTTALLSDKVSTSPVHPPYSMTAPTTTSELPEISPASPSILTMATSVSQAPTKTTETTITSETPLLTSTAAEKEIISTTQSSTARPLSIHSVTETTRVSLDTDRAVLSTKATTQTSALVHESSSTFPSTVTPKFTTRVTPVLTSRVAVATTRRETQRSPYSEVVDECTKLICVSGQLLLFNKSQSCPYDPTPPNCGLLGFAVLVNGDKCCPRWDCPCRCSVFPDLNLITFDGKSVAIYKAALYVVAQLPNETVSILVQECSGPDDTLVWNFTNLCLAALNITHKSNEVLINRLQRRLYVNSGYAKPRFKKFGFEILDTGNMYLIRSPAGLKIQWFHTTGMMVIEMDSYNNRLPTMGLCGSCDGNPLNDLTLSNGTVVPEQEDPAVFIDSWQIPNTTSYVSHSRRREVNCTTGDCSQCMSMLSNRTFTICHPYVPPAMFCEMWVRDVEYVNNPCVALAAYAASCHKFNICMEWRSSDFCPFMCPENLRYQACLPACTAPSCPNQDFEFVPEQCTGLSEGCVCPEGTLLHRPYSALCIPPSKCACTDSFGTPRALGEVWKASLDGCCMYKCENDSIVPVEYNCSNIPQPVCTRTGEITVNLADDSSCCPQKACVCNQSMCKAAPMDCKYGEKLVSYHRQDSCCPEYLCECDPDQCVLDIPVCREDQTLIATRAEGSCCLAHICMCDKCSEAAPVCQDGELLIVDTNSTERCCPVYHCCEYKHMNKQTDICHFHSQLEAVCVDGERGVMRPGQTLVEHRDQGVCYTTQCTHTLDSPNTKYLLTVLCVLQNQIYIPPKDPSSCCGMCKNVSCLIRSENGSVTITLFLLGRSWVSDCMRYDCMDTLSGPVRVSHPYSCPPFNETECMKIGGTIMSYMDGCCKTCKEDGKSCQKVTVRMTIRKNDCRSNRPVNIVSCDGKCPSASIYNYNINTYARFCKCCREMGLQRRSVQLYCSGNSTWVSYTIQEPTDCSCQWS
uniref:Otogelin-like n=1 Tax=Sinocyclocheilus rhinocerous TaxID=307959 RepID=A0A673LF66_9TELE